MRGANLKIKKVTMIFSAVYGVALLACSGWARAADDLRVRIMAGCTVKPEAFDKLYGERYSPSRIDDLECVESSGRLSILEYSGSSPNLRRNSMGLYDVKLECASYEASLDFHRTHAFSEVFVRVGDYVYRPFLLAPLESREFCGLIGGFDKVAAVSLCEFLRNSSSGKIACEIDP